MRIPFIFRRLSLVAAAALAVACSRDASGPTDPLSNGLGSGDDRLLSDREMATQADPSPAQTDESWVRWVRANEHPIRSLTSRQPDDLRFLEPLLAGKRIVQLGESGHGVREFDLVKVRLIRYLHEELGYDVIAFESGLYDCWSANQRMSQMTSLTLMRHCPFGVWHTAEVLPLFDYIKSTQATAHPLTLAGFDIQVSSPENASAPTLLGTVIASQDLAYATRIRQLDTTFVVGGSLFANGDQGLKAVATYDSLTAWFDAHMPALEAVYGAGAQNVWVARQLAYSRSVYLRHLRAGQADGDFTSDRDPGMANNLDALLARIYPGKKVIVWAHNYHVQADRGHSYENGDPSTGVATMGTWVAQRHASEVYTIGLFMYRGTAADNARRVYTVSPPDPFSLEATFYPVRMKQFFVDLSHAGTGPGTEWIRQMQISRDWGVTPLLQVIGNQYQGILFVDTTSPPNYI
jgi:erythromycin esterase